MKANYYNNVVPQTKEAVGFPLNHVDLDTDQENFIEAVYDCRELTLKKEELAELIQDLKDLTPDDIEYTETIDEINKLVEEL
jgi:hypothetical protein